MTAESVWQWIISLATSAGAAAGFSWLFKESLGRALDRALHRDLEAYKSELSLQSQQQVERLRADLQLRAQERLEQLRAEFSAQNESIRHELQKQLLRAQLATTKTHEVYSQLIQKLRVAEGKIAGLWGARFAPDFTRYGDEDLRRILEDTNPAGQDRDEFLALLSSDRNTAIEKLEQLRRKREINDARKLHDDAKNHVVVEGIFMTKPVRDLAFETLTSLWGAWVAVHVGEDARAVRAPGNFHEDFTRATARATAQLTELEEKMRADLLPASIALAPAGKTRT